MSDTRDASGRNAFQAGGILGIYLAAGQSSRMGAHKLSLPMNGTRLGSLALQTALRSELDGVLVVTRPDDPLEWLELGTGSSAATEGETRETWQRICCVDAASGQAHSLRCGIERAQALQARAVVVLLADQPFVSVEMINRLLQTFHASRAEASPHTLDYVASSHQELTRPPILFAHTLFPQLLTLQGDAGARQMLRTTDQTTALHGACIEFANARWFEDVDTPLDYERVLGN